MSSVHQPTADDKYYALEEYKLAFRLLLLENKVCWERFKVLALVNSGLLAAWGVLPRQEQYWGIGLAIAGLGVSVSWFFISLKMAANTRFWAEATHGPGAVLKFGLLSKGAHNKYFHGLSKWRRVRASSWQLIVPAVFGIVWAAMLIYYSVQFLRSLHWFNC